MATIIDMPKLSDTMSVGTLINWLKNVGDSVEVGDLLAEIETDKATMELEALDDGVILAQYVGAGTQVAIGEPIMALGEAGEEAPAVQASAAKAEEPKEASPAAVADPAGQTKAASAAAPGPEEVSKVEAAPAPAAPAAPAGDGNGRAKASPLAKKIAADRGISLAGIKGTGPGGRIVKADVLAAPAGGAPAVAAPFVAPAGAEVAVEGDLPVSNMRATIARRLVESKTQLPHFYLQTEIDAAPLLDLRKQLNASLEQLPPEQGGMKLTVNDFILKASAEALRRVPEVNRSWMGDKIHQHAAVHLAFGVAVDEGLLTPVIRDAHAKGLRQIAADAKALIGKARNKKLKPDEMSGSTFTVTNLGMFGIQSFYGIINPPNAAILSVGATEERAVVKDGQIVPGLRMGIGLSGDHRTIDGAVAARFLQALAELLENPALMLV